MLTFVLQTLGRRPAPAPVATVARYRGMAAGWQPIGAPRPLADAQRLAAIARRISPAATIALR